MVSKPDKKLITKIVIIKVIIVIAFVILVFEVIPVETEIVCITEPCINPIEHKSGIDLITQHFEQVSEPVACIQIFDPVCDINGMTWSNQCIADNAGATVAFKGMCP